MNVLKSKKLIGIFIVGWLAVGSAHSSFLSGLDSLRNGDFQHGVELITTAAEQGDAIAQFNLGDLYYRGMAGLEQDKKKGVFWIRESSKNGFDVAFNQILWIGLTDRESLN
jgi:TPR repeat protein